MSEKIKWLTPVFGFDADVPHVGVQKNGWDALHKLKDDLLGSGHLVGFYVPEGTEDRYQPGEQRGRVVGAARLVEMPAGRTPHDYWYNDWDGSRRWPYGWPCTVVYAPKADEGPILRYLVDSLHPGKPYADYVQPFRHGPFKLGFRMSEKLTAIFSAFPRLA